MVKTGRTEETVKMALRVHQVCQEKMGKMDRTERTAKTEKMDRTELQAPQVCDLYINR